MRCGPQRRPFQSLRRERGRIPHPRVARNAARRRACDNQRTSAQPSTTTARHAPTRRARASTRASKRHSPASRHSQSSTCTATTTAASASNSYETQRATLAPRALYALAVIQDDENDFAGRLFLDIDYIGPAATGSRACGRSTSPAHAALRVRRPLRPHRLSLPRGRPGRATQTSSPARVTRGSLRGASPSSRGAPLRDLPSVAWRPYRRHSSCRSESRSQSGFGRTQSSCHRETRSRRRRGSCRPFHG
jgi:hypothetical protein